MLDDLVRRGGDAPDEEVVVFNTGAAQKFVELLGHVAPDAYRA